MFFWVFLGLLFLPILLWFFFTVLTVYFGPIVPVVLLALLGFWIFRMFRKRVHKA
jgi:hypothetical protein